MDDLPKAALALDDAIRNLLLPAQSWQPTHKLNWIDIMGNDYQLGLLFLDERGHMIQAELDNPGLLLFGILPTFFC